jgi:hypothetical protein
MPEFRTVGHLACPVPESEKLTMPEQVLYRTKLIQTSIFLVRYQNKIMNARMLMPALVSSMPMPSYVVSHSDDDKNYALLRATQILFTYPQ